MRSGKLRRVITVQRSTSTVNDFGTPELVWADHCTLRAEVLEQSATESLGDQGAQDEAAIAFHTRFVEGLTAADRVSFQGGFWNIRKITEIGMQRGLELHCTMRQEEA